MKCKKPIANKKYYFSPSVDDFVNTKFKTQLSVVNLGSRREAAKIGISWDYFLLNIHSYNYRLIFLLYN